jgi:methionine-rich copper-binding protein CopC
VTLVIQPDTANMGWINRRSMADRRVGGRLRPKFDHLESRVALSGSAYDPSAVSPSASLPLQAAPSSPYLSIVSTSPAGSSVVTTSPTTLLVTFDRPVDAFTLGAGDFSLVHVASDGSTSPLTNGEAWLSEGLDPSDSSGRTVALTLSKELAQGRYELLLNPDNQIQGLDRSWMAPASSAPILSDFTFTSARPGLASATELGTLGTQESVVPVVLDLENDPEAVRYYRFEVAPGHHWLVGLENSAHSDGGPLDSSVSLFDTQGRLISTANQGLPSDPSDPYLFAGLDPGTYYVGIAASSNLLDASVSSSQARAAINPAGSGDPFQLTLVADPADQPTELLGLRVDHADPLSTMPTGLTLQFSGGLSLASLADPGQPALTLVDQSGKAWSLTPTGYNASLGQLSLAFDQPLTPGSYTLELPGAGGLVDLAGWAPVASGLPAGTLGSFAVAPAVGVVGDLGPILPGLAASGIGAKVEVGPGGPTSVSFVAIEAGLYAIEGVSSGSGVRFSILDQAGNVLATGPSPFFDGETIVSLTAGVYRVVLTTDFLATEVSLSVRQKQGMLSSLLDSGVAQGPALNLRLVTPQANFGQPENSSTDPTAETSSSPSSSALGNPGSSPGQTSSVRSANSSPTLALGLATPSGPTVAGFLYGVGPVGRPSSQSGLISFVGTSGPSGLASLASNEEHLAAGLITVPVSVDGGAPFDLDDAPANPEPRSGGLASTGAGITQKSGLLAQSPGSRVEDDKALADAEWIGQLVADAMDWLAAPSTKAAGEAENHAMLPNAPSLPIGRETLRLEENRLESASLTSPLAIGVVLGTIVLGYYRKIMGRVPNRPKPRPRSTIQPLLAGPHRRTRARVH